MTKTYNIITYGCAMNRSDSERIASTLEKLGYREAKRGRAPDLLVFNACSVRQSAINRIYGQVDNLQRLKKNNPRLKVVVTGCVLPKDRQGFFEKFDLFFNIKDLTKLPQLLKKLEAGREILAPSVLVRGKKFSQEDIEYFKIRAKATDKFSALLPVSFGCSRFCTYCAVPYTRGLEINRLAREILKEARSLLSRGFREITLLGQTVSSWRDPERARYEFVDLLRSIEEIPGRFWIRFASPYVLDFDDRLIRFLARSKKVNNYVNLPLQSGSDQILKRMNRRYTVARYLRVLNGMKKKIPDFSFSTDVIVGFCGETEKQFQNTYDVFAKIRPTMAFIAPYSPRPGTFAQRLMQDSVPNKTKKARFKKLTQLLRQTAQENLQKEIGRTPEVLVDTWLPQKKECLGKTKNFKTVRFKSKKNLTGQFVNVKIIKAREFELRGVLSRK